MSSADVADPEVQEVAWDLAPLLDGDPSDPVAAVDAMLAEAQQRADAFAERYAGRVAELDGARPRRGDARARRRCRSSSARAGTFGGLHFSTDTADPARGALFQRVQEKATPIETKLLFFELEWAALDDERADALLATDGLDFCRHHLRTARRYRPHLLSEPEEKILAEKALTSRNAWGRLFEEQVAALQVQLEDGAEPVSLEVALSHLHSARPRERAHAAERVTAALEPGLRTRGFVFNTLLADKMVDDRLRGYPHWLASRNLANEASDESVQALVTAVRNRYELPRRWYRLKAQAARARPARGLRPHGRGHRREPGRRAGREARELVQDSYSTFSPVLGDLVHRFFDERWIDAPVRPGKRAGAFCAYAVAVRAPVRDAQLDLAPPRRADARARARPRRARRARRPPGHLPHGDAADAGGDRERVRRDDRLRPPARARRDAGVAAVAAGGVDRGLDRHRLPPDRHEPVRGPHPHRAPRERRARARPHRRAVGAVAGGAAGRRGRGHRGLPQLVVLRPPLRRASRATSTPTPTASCSRSRSTAATRRRARRSSPPTSSCSRPAARARPRSSARSSASTSPTRASGTAASRSSSASSTRPSRPRATPAGCRQPSNVNCSLRKVRRPRRL